MTRQARTHMRTVPSSASTSLSPFFCDSPTKEADAHLAQWAEEDFYVSLPDELALIAGAGFPRPDCFWRDGLIAVYGAFKDG